MWCKTKGVERKKKKKQNEININIENKHACTYNKPMQVLY